MPLQISSRGMNYDVTWANGAGGKDNGKGQGESRGGGNRGNGANVSAGSAAGVSKGGRFNSLNASLKAFGKANSYSPVGAMAQYSAALGAFATIDSTDDPTAQELAVILAKVANKDKLTAETINWIHQLLLSKEMVKQSTLDDAASILAPSTDPNTDSNALAMAKPTLAELLAEQASLMQEKESNQGLGPIY
jgi:hypothetical protein